MKIYGISGLGADKRVFNFLTLNYEFTPIHWISPKKKESIKEYSKRLSTVIDIENDFCLIGVSFGGLVATEISKILNPRITILISSAHTKNELNPIFRWFGKIKIIRFIPTSFFHFPKRIATYLFGAKNNKLLYAILKDTDPSFVKWALYELTNWQNTTLLKNVIKINGTSDKLIPPRGTTKMLLIDKGAHFMIVDNAPKISEFVNLEIAKIINQSNF